MIYLNVKKSAAQSSTDINAWNAKEKSEVEKQILFIKGTENQNTVAKILFENGYTVKLTMAAPNNSSKKIKALEYWRGEKE